MSVVDEPASPVRDRFSLRLLNSELRLIATRRRNQVGLAVLCGIPVLLAVTLLLSGAVDRTADAPPMVSMMYGNGLLVVIGTFSVESLIFLPMAVAVLAADSISAEAGAGTLRYLLAVPIGRTRLLVVKYLAAAMAIIVTVAAVALTAAIAGLALFGTGDLITLSGKPLAFGDSLWRVGMVCGYVMIMLVTFLAVAMFAATLTDQPAGAIVGSLLYVLVDQLLATTPELSPLHPFLLTGYWRDWGDFLRVPMETGEAGLGLVVSGVYALVGFSAAWARLTTRDIN